MRWWLAGVLVAVVALPLALEGAEKRGAKRKAEPALEQADVPVPAEPATGQDCSEYARRAASCWELGKWFGAAAPTLPAEWLEAGIVFENYCRRGRDPTLKRVPTEEDVARIANSMQAFTRTRANLPFVKQDKLRQQMENGRAQEGQILDELLR
jgi:hypothetical protein